LAAVEWEVSEKLAAQLRASGGVASRKMFTWNGSAGVDFRAPIPGFSADFINYIRGDVSLEINNGGTFRDRYQRTLGDIVNPATYLLGVYQHNDYGYGGYRCGAGGVFVPLLGGDSPSQQPCDKTETSFLSAAEVRAYRDRIKNFSENGRPETVFVAANDGMLHAFQGGQLSANPRAGQERFAYVPRAVHGRLGQLARPGYQHQYYVDGAPMVADIILNGEWRSVLVGSTGRGKTADGATWGGSFFALDVEDPDNFGADKVLWEFTSNDLGTPADGEAVIAAIPGGGSGHRWVAVFGNGYNSRNGRAGLFIVPLEANGHLRAEFIPVPGSGQNGLGTPYLLSLDDTNLYELAYAGDIQGNMWKFDLQTRSVVKVLEARDSRNVPQPISSPPTTICPDPDDDCNSGHQLVVGTGKFFENSDVSNTQQQSIYGVRLTRYGEPIISGTVANRNNLRVRVYDARHPGRDSFYQEGGFLDFTGPAWKTDDDKTRNPDIVYPQQRGYVIDLNAAGMGNALVRAQGTILIPYKGWRNFLQPFALPSTGADVCESGALAGGTAEFNYEQGTWVKSSLFERVALGANMWRDEGTVGLEINRDGKFYVSGIEEGGLVYNKGGGPRKSGRHSKHDHMRTAGPREVRFPGFPPPVTRTGRQSWWQIR
jgi:hypothetical protein